MNWILYSIKTSIFYNFAWFMKEDRHDIYQRQFESTADYFNKPFYMRISIMLKEFIFHHKRWKIRCNHLHKLMKITDRCFQDIPSKIFSSVNCCTDDMNIKQYSAQTTSQWFSEIENATLKKMYDVYAWWIILVKYVYTMSAYLSIWRKIIARSTLINEFKLFIICL